ncbi:MAG: hypothetical protein AABZ74_14680 [Cyanobacteriota bacterium]
MTIVFSFEFVVGIYWYKFSKSLLILDPPSYNVINNKYSEYLSFSFYWFIIIFSFLNGLMTGWVIESRLKNLSTLNVHWQKKQPDFYRKTPGEFRILLPWLVVESPLFLIILGNLFLIFVEKNNSISIIWIMVFSLGFVIGQIIEPLKHYRNTISMDRPEKPPQSILEKISPNFPRNKSLLLGQLYCKIFVPLFFIELYFLIPSFFIIVPFNDDSSRTIVFLFIILGLVIRWFYYAKDLFYFSKINLLNVIFISFKNILSVLALFSTIISTSGNLLSISIISLIVGFFLPWHPNKLR